MLATQEKIHETLNSQKGHPKPKDENESEKHMSESTVMERRHSPRRGCNVSNLTVQQKYLEPGTCPLIFELQPSKKRPLTIKTRVIWGPGVYINIYICVCVYLYIHLLPSLTSTTRNKMASFKKGCVEMNLPQPDTNFPKKKNFLKAIVSFSGKGWTEKALLFET